MTLSRNFKWIAGFVLTPLLLSIVFVAIFGWNWLRRPIESRVAEKTGRALTIKGNLRVALGWPRPHIIADSVSFANPPWTQQRQMIAADVVDITVNFPQLLSGNLVFPEVRLTRPVIFLEQGSLARKSWLLDLNQQDENARIQIDRLTLDQGTLGYDDQYEKTSIRAGFSTVGAQPGAADSEGLAFNVQGQFRGLPLKAVGQGGQVLALRDEKIPYAMTVDATVGHTGVRAVGTITSLLKFSAMDMQLKLHGDSMEQLFPLLGIAAPATRAYVTDGHLLHSGVTWRYENFSGVVGNSDIAGTAQWVGGGKRPALTATLVSRQLDLANMGPLIGARPGSVQAARRATPLSLNATAITPAAARVLPELPFKFDRWDSVDADVELQARTIRHVQQLPLEDLTVHMSLRDAVLKLDPLRFGLAGGQLDAVVSLDGRRDPIQAQVKIQAKKIHIDKLLPMATPGHSAMGQVNGGFDIVGQGNSVARILASANGKASLIVVGGEVSKLLMEKAGLHLWEILQLKLSGDQQVKLRCAVADFDIKNGKMQAQALIIDTQVTTLDGAGSIDLGQERLDLRLNQKTKDTSPLALRSPIYIRGSFAKPEVGVDKLRLATRALGALSLGIVNPVLAMIPLVDAGPGKDSDCRQLVRNTGTSQ